MTKLQVSLKNGHSFFVTVKNVEAFYQSIKDGASPTATLNVHIEGHYWLNLGDISAIHPADVAA